MIRAAVATTISGRNGTVAAMTMVKTIGTEKPSRVRIQASRA
jgi:hypothetical protein